MDLRGDDQLVGVGLAAAPLQVGVHLLGGADAAEPAPAARQLALLIGPGVRRGLLRARQRAGTVLHQPDHGQVVGQRELLGAVLGLRDDRGDPEHHPWLGEPGGRFEPAAIAGDSLGRVGAAEVAREGEAGSERSGGLPPVEAGAEDP